MRISVALAAALIAGAASSSAIAQKAVDEPPLYIAPNRVAPSFDVVRKDIEQKLDCASRRIPGQKPSDATSPVPVSICPPYFPAVMQDAGVEGNCISMFDLDEAGAPVNVETRCDVGARGVPRLPEAWGTLARRAFAFSTENALLNSRYQPADESGAEARRQNVSRKVHFGFGAMPYRFEPLQEFQRSPPAPPLESNSTSSSSTNQN